MRTTLSMMLQFRQARRGFSATDASSYIGGGSSVGLVPTNFVACLSSAAMDGGEHGGGLGLVFELNW